MTLKICSTCWPWDHNYFDPCDVADILVDLGADEVCIRTPAYTQLYNPEWHDRLAKRARLRGIEVSIWPVISLYYPEKQAQAIKDAYARYQPKRIVLDAERAWVLNYIANLPKLLTALGRMPVPVGLGSYRRASLHQDMHWQTWLKHTVNGEYVIDFQAAQLYPIGWRKPKSWEFQFKTDIDSHEAEHIKAHRPDIPWLPFMPAFSEGKFLDTGEMWYPVVDGVAAAVDYMRARLGSRLLGFNVWSLDQDLLRDKRLKPLYEFWKNYTG